MQSTYERGLAGSSSVIPVDDGCQLRVQRRGRNLHQFRGFGPEQRGADRQLGIKLSAAPPGRARAGGHSPRAPRPRRPAGRGWSCSRRSGPRLASPPAGRSAPKPARAGVPAAPACPAIETSARLPGANTGAKRGSPISASIASPPAPRGQPRSSRRRCGRDTAAPHRGGAPARHRAAIAAAGAPACRAAARGRATGSIRRSGRGWLSSAAGSDGRSRLSAICSGVAGVRSHSGSRPDGSPAAASRAASVSGAASSGRV